MVKKSKRSKKRTMKRKKLQEQSAVNGCAVASVASSNYSYIKRVPRTRREMSVLLDREKHSSYNRATIDTNNWHEEQKKLNARDETILRDVSNRDALATMIKAAEALTQMVTNLSHCMRFTNGGR